MDLQSTSGFRLWESLTDAGKERWGWRREGDRILLTVAGLKGKRQSGKEDTERTMPSGRGR
jgi:hypothetical protein